MAQYLTRDFDHLTKKCISLTLLLPSQSNLTAKGLFATETHHEKMRNRAWL